MKRCSGKGGAGTRYGLAPMWQFYFVTAQGQNRGAFQAMTEDQGWALQELGAAGWELAGVTTLENGWLHLAFKRFVRPEAPQPAVPDSQYL